MKPIDFSTNPNNLFGLLCDRDCREGEVKIDVLPEYYEMVPAAMRETMITSWFRVKDFVQQDGNPGEAVFCQPDGSKSFVTRCSQGRTIIGLFRSGVEDARFLDFLAPFSTRSHKDLQEAFRSLPTFTPQLVGDFFSFSDESCEGRAKDSALKLAEAYRPVSSDEYNPYSFDIRVFALLHAMRLLLWDLRINLFLINDGPASSILRVFMGHTAESIPRRPPIFCCLLNDSLRKRARAAAEGIKLGIRKVPKEAGPEALLRSILALRFPAEAPNELEWRQATLNVRSTIGNTEAIVEIGGTTLSDERVGLTLEMLQAAIDATDAEAVNSLMARADLSTARKAEEFRQLLTVYRAGLPSAREGAEEVDRSWQVALQSIIDASRWISPGAVRERSKQFFVKNVLEKLRSDAGTRRPDPDDLCRQLKAFDAMLRLDLLR